MIKKPNQNKKKYSSEFFRYMPTSDEETHKQPCSFRWKRVWKKFFLLTLCMALFSGVYISIMVVIKTVQSNELINPAMFLLLPIIEILICILLFLFIFGIQNFIWAFVLELMDDKPNAKIVCGVLGSMLISISAYSFATGDLCRFLMGEKYPFSIPICVFLGGLMTLYLLRKKDNSSSSNSTQTKMSPKREIK